MIIKCFSQFVSKVNLQLMELCNNDGFDARIDQIFRISKSKTPSPIPETGSYYSSIRSPFWLKVEPNNCKVLQQWHTSYKKSSRWQIITGWRQGQLQLIQIEAILFSGCGIKSQIVNTKSKNQFSKHTDQLLIFYDESGWILDSIIDIFIGMVGVKITCLFPLPATVILERQILTLTWEWMHAIEITAEFSNKTLLVIVNRSLDPDYKVLVGGFRKPCVKKIWNNGRGIRHTLISQDNNDMIWDNYRATPLSHQLKRVFIITISCSP